jgi:crotonobetainyl-CoA:carnitine CoA-transferase CaiB-like acyl-CoA transferase
MRSESGSQPVASATGPLIGIKILDISTVIAAPLAATLLGDLGA